MGAISVGPLSVDNCRTVGTLSGLCRDSVGILCRSVEPGLKKKAKKVEGGRAREVESESEKRKANSESESTEAMDYS